MLPMAVAMLCKKRETPSEMRWSKVRLMQKKQRGRG
jgi:hypothetical protein